jgi:hypothetical protein
MQSFVNERPTNIWQQMVSDHVKGPMFNDQSATSLENIVLLTIKTDADYNYMIFAM